MSEFSTALTISGSIFAVMMVTQLGRREYTWHKVLFPLLGVTGFGWAYLRHMPTNGNAVWLYLVGIAIGAVFAVLASITTSVGQNGATGKLFTTTGAGFVTTWLVAVVLRVSFVWGVDNVPDFREHVGIFMMNNQLVEDSIAPFFVLMALTTFVGRVFALHVRTRRVATCRTEQPVLLRAAV